MKEYWKWIFATALALIAAVILTRIVVPGRRAAADQSDEDDTQQALKVPSRVSVQNGQTILTLDASAQSRVGMAVAPLKALASRKQITAPAIVLSAQDLVTARTGYVAATANLEKARSNMQVAQQEYDRLKTLYQDRQNASEKDLQAAQGALRSAQADAQAAQKDLALQAAAVRQSWGNVLAQWVSDNSPALDRVLDQHDFLIQVTLPAGAASTVPENVLLEVPGSNLVQAKLISPFPRVDPRIQGIGFLYLAPNQSGLAPGLNLVARIPLGRTMRGVLIPQSAIVWWQGNAWVYQQTVPGRFVRRLVPTDAPVTNGFFVSTGLATGDQIVVQGAQMLLSEELRSQIQAED